MSCTINKPAEPALYTTPLYYYSSNSLQSAKICGAASQAAASRIIGTLGFHTLLCTIMRE
jgi:hypothetical protein